MLIEDLLSLDLIGIGNLIYYPIYDIHFIGLPAVPGINVFNFEQIRVNLTVHTMYKIKITSTISWPY